MQTISFRHHLTRVAPQVAAYVTKSSNGDRSSSPSSRSNEIAEKTKQLALIGKRISEEFPLTSSNTKVYLEIVKKIRSIMEEGWFGGGGSFAV